MRSLIFALGCSIALIFNPSASAQKFVPEQVVFPITDFKPDLAHLALLSVQMKFGTGFCLDPECRFVGTNYHVAKIMGKSVRIKGVPSEHLYLDTGADDDGAHPVDVDNGALSLKYTPAHDLAIYEMRHPLKHFHGASFDTDEPDSHAEVDIYAYPLHWNPKRTLVVCHGRYIGITVEGLLAFHYEEDELHPGASGGIVVDRHTEKIIGILSGGDFGKNRIVLAVPVKELENFVTRTQPYLQASLFPKTVFISPVAADLYPPHIWPRLDHFTHREAEAPEVTKLRNTAQLLAYSMRNFTATQTLAWGRQNREPDLADAYETLIVDGQQAWRRPGSQKLLDSIPIPLLEGALIVPGGEWSWLPQLIGTELNLRIHQAPDAVLAGRTIHVFQYSGTREDKACSLRSGINVPIFRHMRTTFYACHGEVWVDDSGSILGLSQDIDISGSWHNFRCVMTYGSLARAGRRYPVPVTLAVQIERGQTYWCRGLYTDYEMFGVKSRLLLSANSLGGY
jgi:hypothetical protein